MDQNFNIKRFEELLGSVQRPGVKELMSYIKTTDFYTAPASTRFHLSCEGGLLQHSLNVYDCLVDKKSSKIWSDALSQVPDDSLIIVALLHDLCKANFYRKSVKNQKTYDQEKVKNAESWQVKKDDKGSFIWETVPSYEVDDTLPLGHGEKSALLVQGFLKLSLAEVLSIRWHMGFSEEKSQYSAIGSAMEKYPLVLALHEADLEASKILELNM